MSEADARRRRGGATVRMDGAPSAPPSSPEERDDAAGLDGATVRDIDVKRCAECGARFGIDAAFCPFCGITLSSTTWDPARDELVGRVVDQRYEIMAPLGEGGMGTVYRVRHVTLDREFAMKVLRRDLAKDGDLAARFTQEAHATAAIKHPAVVSISDFGVFDDGTPYFVMELLKGETLAARMRGRGPMAPADAAGVARLVAEGLEAAHAAGVVHRDLKPENVFLVGKSVGRSALDAVRIVDFGAAKIVGASKLTRPGIVFGTPYYMSPEQASGERVDARSDVYSLGVLLFEMLTGDVPFTADTYMGVLTKHMFQEPAKPSERVPAGVRLGALEDAVLKMLAKDPNQRFPSMREVALALDGVVAGAEAPPGSPRAPGPSRPAVVRGGRTTADRIEDAVARTIDREARRRRQAYVIGGATAFFTILCGSMVLAFAMKAPPHETPTAVKPELAPAATSSDVPRVAPEPAPSVMAAPSASASSRESKPVAIAAPPSVVRRPTSAPASSPAAPAPSSAVVVPKPRTEDPAGFRDPWSK